MNEDSLIFLGGLTALVAVNLSPLAWLFQKDNYGSLILDVGQLEKSKLVWGIALAITLVVLFLWDKVGASLNIVTFERIPAYLTAVVYLVATGLSHVEFREKGICYRFKLIKWSYIKTAKWELNLLEIKLKSKSNRELILLIPIDYRDAVNQILAKYLPEQPRF